MCKQLVVEISFIGCIKALNHTFSCKGMCSGTNYRSAWSVGAALVQVTFPLPASGSWSVILKSIRRIMLEISQPEAIKMAVINNSESFLNVRKAPLGIII